MPKAAKSLTSNNSRNGEKVVKKRLKSSKISSFKKSSDGSASVGAAGSLANGNFTLQTQQIPIKKKIAQKQRKMASDKQPLPHTLKAFHQKKLYGSNPSTRPSVDVSKFTSSPLKSMDKSFFKSGVIQSSVPSTRKVKEGHGSRKRKSVECSRSNTALSTHLLPAPKPAKESMSHNGASTKAKTSNYHQVLKMFKSQK